MRGIVCFEGATGRGHHARRRIPVNGEAVGEPGEIAAHRRPRVRLGHRRGHPLVLANLRQDLVAGDHVEGEPARGDGRTQRLRQLLLVTWVAISMQQRDGDRFGVVCLRLRERLGDDRIDGRIGEWGDDDVWRHALGHRHDLLSRDQRRDMVLRQIVQGGPFLTPQFEHIGEALRGTRNHGCPTPLEEQVRHYRGTVRDVRHPIGGQLCRGQRMQHPLRTIGRHAQHLGGVHRAIVVQGGEVSERAAHIDADRDARSVIHAALRLPLATTAIARCTGTIAM